MVSKNTNRRFQHALAFKNILIGEGVTNTDGAIEIEGLTEDGLVIITSSEDPGAALVLSDIKVENGRFIVYTKNTGTDARAILVSKKVFYMVLKK